MYELAFLFCLLVLLTGQYPMETGEIREKKVSHLKTNSMYSSLADLRRKANSKFSICGNRVAQSMRHMKVYAWGWGRGRERREEVRTAEAGQRPTVTVLDSRRYGRTRKVPASQVKGACRPWLILTFTHSTIILFMFNIHRVYLYWELGESSINSKGKSAINLT